MSAKRSRTRGWWSRLGPALLVAGMMWPAIACAPEEDDDLGDEIEDVGDELEDATDEADDGAGAQQPGAAEDEGANGDDGSQP